MDKKLRSCTLTRASLRNGLSQDDLNYLKKSGVKASHSDGMPWFFLATDNQFLNIIDHFGQVVIHNDNITIYDDYLE